MSQEFLEVDLENLIRAMLRQYKNKYVVIRETIQNSIDAGAKHIDVTITNDYLNVEDDGQGMDFGEIRQYWNTICRTKKRRGSYRRVRSRKINFAFSFQ